MALLDCADASRPARVARCTRPSSETVTPPSHSAASCRCSSAAAASGVSPVRRGGQEEDGSGCSSEGQIHYGEA